MSLENALYMSSFLARKAVPALAIGSSIVFAISPWYGLLERIAPEMAD